MTDITLPVAAGSLLLTPENALFWPGRTTIFERVESALAILRDVPRAMDRMLMTGGDLPDQYMIYTLPDASPTAHFDDQEAARNFRVSVTIYSRAGLARLPNVDGAMLNAGFTRSGERAAPPKGEHYALEKSYYFYDEENIP